MPPTKQMIGRAAADTLGYIMGDIPGAVAADKFYQKMTNGRKRQRPITGSAPYAKKRKPARRIAKKAAPTRSDYYAGAKRTGKRVSVRRASVARIKPPMKRAIQKLFTSSKPHGFYSMSVFYRLWFGGDAGGGTTYDNKQKVDYLGNVFFPQQFMNAASILFRDRGQTVAPVPGYDPLFDFERNGFKLKVIYSKIKNVYRNNSNRAYKIKIFICRPKSRGVDNPLADWVSQLAEEERDTNNDYNGGNVLDNTITQWGLDPRSCQGWSAQWAAEVLEVLLQPGQTYEHVLVGPTNTMLDFNKFQINGVHSEAQKMVRYSFAIYHTDLVGSDTNGTVNGSVGYFAEDGALFKGEGIAVHQEHIFKIEMPEQTGFEVHGVAGGEQSLTKRRNAFARTMYGDVQVGAIVRVDDTKG